MTTREGKTEFKLDVVADTEPMSEDGMHAYFLEHYAPELGLDDLKWVTKYLESKGFCSDVHYVAPRTVEKLLYIMRNAFYHWAPLAGVQQFKDLFEVIPQIQPVTSVTDSNYGCRVTFWRRGSENSASVWCMTKKPLRDALSRRGYVPVAFCFVINDNGEMYLHYEFILGNMLICKVDLDSLPTLWKVLVMTDEIKFEVHWYGLGD